MLVHQKKIFEKSEKSEKILKIRKINKNPKNSKKSNKSKDPYTLFGSEQPLVVAVFLNAAISSWTPGQGFESTVD